MRRSNVYQVYLSTFSGDQASFITWLLEEYSKSNQEKYKEIEAEIMVILVNCVQPGGYYNITIFYYKQSQSNARSRDFWLIPNQ